MKPFIQNRVTAMLAMSLLVACSDSLGLDASRRALGIFQIENPTAPTQQVGDTDPRIRWNLPPTSGVTFPVSVIEAPDTVLVGQSFEVTVNTIGPSGCWAEDGLDLAVNAPLIQLTAWDRHSGAEVCTTILRFLSHTATVSLGQPGEWTIRASGRRVRGEEEAEFPLTAERTIHVRPAN